MRPLLIHRRALFMLGAGAVALAAPARARSVNAHRGVALRGWAVAAYATQAAPRRGEARHAVPWSGAAWHFSSAEHAALFRAAPERHAPRFGGFCAFGVAGGYLVDVDPEAWSIVEGRLYLNYSRSVHREWLRDVPGNIARAEANWPRLSQG
jgi:hypothetical protein